MFLIDLPTCLLQLVASFLVFPEDSNIIYTCKTAAKLVPFMRGEFEVTTALAAAVQQKKMMPKHVSLHISSGHAECLSTIVEHFVSVRVYVQMRDYDRYDMDTIDFPENVSICLVLDYNFVFSRIQRNVHMVQVQGLNVAVDFSKFPNLSELSIIRGNKMVLPSTVRKLCVTEINACNDLLIATSVRILHIGAVRCNHFTVSPLTSLSELAIMDIQQSFNFDNLPVALERLQLSWKGSTRRMDLSYLTRLRKLTLNLPTVRDVGVDVHAFKPPLNLTEFALEYNSSKLLRKVLPSFHQCDKLRKVRLIRDCKLVMDEFAARQNIKLLINALNWSSNLPKTTTVIFNEAFIYRFDQSIGLFTERRFIN